MQQIKTMEPAQVGEVCRIGRQNFTHPWSEQDYMEHLKDDERIYLVAECEGDVAGSCQEQLRAIDLVKALFCEVNPIPVKMALNLMGKEVGGLRAPLTEMEPEHAKVLKQAMEEYGIL